MDELNAAHAEADQLEGATHDVMMNELLPADRHKIDSDSKQIVGGMIGLAVCMLVLSIVAVIVSLAAQPSDETKVVGGPLDLIVVGRHRSDAHIARNIFRHPVEVLRFFGLQPDMTVVEIWPGSEGWFMEILAPYVKQSGQYYAVGNVTTFLNNAKANGNADVYDEVIATNLPTIAPAGSADMVLTFRNLHNWMRSGDAANFFGAMFRALRPGGILGLVEHRQDPDVEQDPKAASGYVTEAMATEMAEAAGFVLVDKSQINSNPKDTKDYEKGVWALPPTLRGVPPAKYKAIGESDRMTLKFSKPAPPT